MHGRSRWLGLAWASLALGCGAAGPSAAAPIAFVAPAVRAVSLRVTARPGAERTITWWRETREPAEDEERLMSIGTLSVDGVDPDAQTVAITVRTRDFGRRFRHATPVPLSLAFDPRDVVAHRTIDETGRTLGPVRFDLEPPAYASAFRQAAAGCTTPLPDHEVAIGDTWDAHDAWELSFRTVDLPLVCEGTTRLGAIDDVTDSAVLATHARCTGPSIVVGADTVIARVSRTTFAHVGLDDALRCTETTIVAAELALTDASGNEVATRRVQQTMSVAVE